MPFTIADVEKHIKDLTPEQKEQWLSVANSALKKCEDEGGSNCDASAIQQANGVVSNADDKDKTFGMKDVEIFAIWATLVSQLKAALPERSPLFISERISVFSGERVRLRCAV